MKTKTDVVPTIPRVLVSVVMLGAAVNASAWTKSPKQAAIPPDAIKAQLESMGFENVQEIESDDGFWGLDAISPDGKPVEVIVHPMTGEMVHEDVD